MKYKYLKFFFKQNNNFFWKERKSTKSLSLSQLAEKKGSFRDSNPGSLAPKASMLTTTLKELIVSASGFDF